jgi:hypothetical protein
VNNFEFTSVPVKHGTRFKRNVDPECAKAGPGLDVFLIGQVMPNGTVRGVCRWTDVGDCLLAVVNSVHDKVAIRVFIPDRNSTPIECDSNTVVFLYSPLEGDWGKYLVPVYKNNTIVAGYNIYLESELKCGFHNMIILILDSGSKPIK